MTWFEYIEAASYVVTVIGLPLAILVFIYEQRRERQNEEEEIYQRLSDEYTAFLKLVLAHPDLQLLRKMVSAAPLNEEQKERKAAIFNILISLFERAYILVYEEKMDRQTQRLWLSWEDYMREWCRRPDFREALPELLQGEDEDFREHIQRIAHIEAKQETTAPPSGCAGGEAKWVSLPQRSAEGCSPHPSPGEPARPGVRACMTKTTL